MRSVSSSKSPVAAGTSVIDRRTESRGNAWLDRRMAVGSATIVAGRRFGDDMRSIGASRSVGNRLPAPGVKERPAGKPDDVLAHLKAGNARFVAGESVHPDASADRRTGLADGQSPFAVVLSCADSRVPPELVFDQGLGSLFVTRTAGQVIDHAVRGSIEYGVLKLKVQLLIVLGHEKCGAVKATLEAVEKGSAALGNDIDALISGIKPAAEKADGEHAADPLDAAVRYNVANVVTQLRENTALAPAIKAGSLDVFGARYDLNTGTVDFL
jgi:carbonic anhydrase